MPLGLQGRMPKAGCTAQRSPQGKADIFLLFCYSHNASVVLHSKYGTSYFQDVEFHIRAGNRA